MSYLDQAQDPRRRTLAIAGVAAIHAALAFTVVTGLTVSGIAPLPDKWDPFTITPETRPTPPPPDPTPPSDTRAQDPVAPQPLVPLPTESAVEAFDPTDVVVVDVTRFADRIPTVIPDPPRVTPGYTPRGAAPSNDQSSWITTADYPTRALRNEAEGTASYHLVVNSSGRVSACEITASSGNSALDDATCRFITRRARFDPATDESGARVVGSYSGKVHWRTPD